MRKHERDVFIISKKDIIRKRRSNMVSLVLVALFVSSLFLSVVYAAMTTSLKVTGDANVIKLYNIVYYNGSTFYEDDLDTPSKQVKINGNPVYRLSEMINLMTDWGTIYMRAGYTIISSGETFNPINNVIIKRHSKTATAPNDYKGALIRIYYGTTTFNNLNKQILIDGNASLVPNTDDSLVAFNGSGTLNLNGNMKLQNNNNSTGDGGAIRLASSDAVVNAEGVLQILDNKAKDGGGIYNDGTLNLSGTVTISGNTATDSNGGGIYSYNDYSKTILSGTVTISNNSVISSGAYGGGIYVNGSSSLYVQCKPSGFSAVRSGAVTFSGNSVEGLFSLGPNVYATYRSRVYMPSGYPTSGMEILGDLINIYS